MIFETIAKTGHEQVVFCHNKDAGLKAIIAVHNTVLGPALGGLRMWPYKSEAEALNDVLRLSRGMTYKNAVAGLNLGGGKAVIIGDPATDKSEALFRAFGRFVNSLNGRYITAEFSGMTLDQIRRRLIRLTEQERALHDEMLQKTITLGIEAVNDVAPVPDLSVEGAASMLSQPDFPRAGAPRNRPQSGGRADRRPQRPGVGRHAHG